MSLSTKNYKQLMYAAECLSYSMNSEEIRTAVGEALLKLLDADYYGSYIWNPAHGKYDDGVSLNMDLKKVKEYEQYYQFHDPITYKLKKRKRATCVTEIIEQKALKKTEFYNDFLSYDGLYWGINLYAYDGTENIGDIRIWRNKNRENFDESSIQLLQMISPHFTNSLRNIRNSSSEKNFGDTSKNHPVLTASWDIKLIMQQFSFTNREAEVIRELLRGKKDECIAEELCIAYSTLRTHIKNIYAKAAVHNRSSLQHKVLNRLTGFT